MALSDHDETAACQSGFRAEFLSAGVAAALGESWVDLVDTSLCENPFYAPWSLVPALDCFADNNVSVAVIWKETELWGLVPLEKVRWYAKVPVTYFRAWRYPHCYLTTPLLREDDGAGVLTALSDLVSAHDGVFLQLPLVDLATVPMPDPSGPRFWYSPRRYSRAALMPNSERDAYLENSIRSKKRKEYRRQERRLAEEGSLQVRVYGAGDDIGAWCDEFLTLERKSWKGDVGTALGQSQADATWFQRTLADAASSGTLDLIRLDLDQKAIAMLVGLRRNGVVHSIKICHDPLYARFSPGVLIELAATRRYLEDPTFRYADSCAAPNHPMIDKIWRDRLEIATVNIAGARVVSRATLKVCRTLERIRNFFPKPEDGFDTEV